jgi:ABC-type transporter Mla MlaB component
MALKIKKLNSFVKLEGNLNRLNVHILQTEFQNIFEESDQVTISIEDLDGIDRYGVNALAKLHNESILKHKKLSIIGLGSKELFDHFRSNDAA